MEPRKTITCYANWLFPSCDEAAAWLVVDNAEDVAHRFWVERHVRTITDPVLNWRNDVVVLDGRTVLSGALPPKEPRDYLATALADVSEKHMAGLF